ncbi:hypothetical protein C8J57DRAFT_1502280 [Mycena rebaudengoi]|nr:hypothetical protein C8J57DRAFT_1502280 [Mycena rebaudengoi]
MVGMMSGSDASAYAPSELDASDPDSDIPNELQPERAALVSRSTPACAAPDFVIDGLAAAAARFQYAAHTQGAEWGSRCRVEHGFEIATRTMALGYTLHPCMFPTQGNILS